MCKKGAYYCILSAAMYLIAVGAYYCQSTSPIYNINATYSENYTSVSSSQHDAKIAPNLVFSSNKEHTPTYNSFKRWLEDTHVSTVIPMISFNFAQIVFLSKRQFYTSSQYLVSLNLRVHSLRGPPASFLA